MHYSYEGEPDAAFGFIGRAKQELERTRVRMVAEGREQGFFHLALSPDAYCYGWIIPAGIEGVHIVVPGETRGQLIPALASLPDFVSGVVVGGGFSTTPAGTRAVGDLYPTNETARLHKSELRGTPAWEACAIARLTVSPWGAFWEFTSAGVPVTASDYAPRFARAEPYVTGPGSFMPFPFGPPIDPFDPTAAVYIPPDEAPRPTPAFAGGYGERSQYQCLRGSLYSGKMRGLVQALLGFGRQVEDENGNITSIYGQVIDERDALYEKIAERKLTGYDDTVKENGLQIRYDYRWFRTHGLCKAADGTWWVVEISSLRGVVAIRLPIHDLTDDPLFREKLEELGSDEGLMLFDEFGGFPNGQAFPGVAAQFAAFERAGKITRLATAADLHDFYWCTPYSQAMGWSFNDAGTEAHNTAYYYKDDSMPYPNVQVGVHYCVSLNIGSKRNRTPSGALKEVIDAYASAWESLRDKPEYEDIIDAAIYKLDWMTPQQYSELAGLDDEESLKKVDSFVLESELVGSASVTKAGEGYLFWTTWQGPQIKFPSYESGILISHDFRPAMKWYNGKVPYCHTTMHVFFCGNELKYVKYYYNPDQVSGTSEQWSSQEPCAFMDYYEFGSSSGGPLAIPAGFYTTDIDDRDEGRPDRLEGWGRGWDLGYLQVSITDRLEWPPEAYLFRLKTWRTHVETESVLGGRTTTAIAIPFMDRCAYMAARFDQNTGRSSSMSEGNVSEMDPHVYRTWRNFGGWTSYIYVDGTWIPKGTHPAGCGIVTRRTVWFEEELGAIPPVASVGNCREAADSGSWASPCQDAEMMTYYYPPPPNQGTGRNWGAEATLTLNLVCYNAPIPTLMKREYRNDSQVGYWEPKWFRPSPDELGFAYYIHATENCLGGGDAIVFMDDMIGNLQKVVGTPNLPAMRKDTVDGPTGGPGVNFIGVID